MKIFIDRLRGLIDAKDMTQKELANAIGVTEVTISRYLSGGRNPRIDIVNKIAKHFNVTTDYLLGVSDVKEIETIAAHHDGKEYTKEELEEIEQFKNYVKSKRNKE